MEKLKVAEEKIGSLSKLVPNIAQPLPVSDAEPKHDQQKRKAKNDLINPNIRKRKGFGAKIGGE